MPRKYKSSAVKFTVMKYDENEIRKAIKSVQNGQLSINKAAEVFNIKRSTLQNKMKNKHPKKQGGQCALTNDEEKCLVNMLITTGNWGFPLTKVDLRHITKRFLDNRQTKVAAFKDNFPGEDWAVSFLKRHKKEISERTTQNITPTKAALSVETMSAYIGNLEKTVEGVPPQNIANYDETNFTDDPGSKKAIFRRGIKYPENIMAHSKTSTSVMFCGTATGVILPLYVVYRAKYVYHTWIENGPPGARYNATPSGWFDGSVFTDWFKTVYIPFARKLPGAKVLIGDNLSSHFSEEVLELAAKENVRFVCLRPNSTHVAQPLDVSFFGPLKRIWRKILTEYKLKHKKVKVIPKDVLTRLLRKTWDHFHRTDNRGKENLKSGFRTCLIVPCDRRPVLRKIDKTVTTEDNVTALSEAVLTYMKELRQPDESTAKKGRKRKVTTAPGLSISVDDLTQPSVSQPKKPRQSKKLKTVEPSKQKKPVKRLQKKNSKPTQNVGTDCETSNSSDDDEYCMASKNCLSNQNADQCVSNKSAKRDRNTSAEDNVDASQSDKSLESKKRRCDTSENPFICPQQKKTVKRVQQQKLKPNNDDVNDVTSKKCIGSPVTKQSIGRIKSSIQTCDSLKKPVERLRRSKPVKNL